MAGRPLRRARMNPARTLEQFLGSITPSQAEAIVSKVASFTDEDDLYDGFHVDSLAGGLVLLYRGLPITKDNDDNFTNELYGYGDRPHPEYEMAWDWAARFWRDRRRARASSNPI